MIPFKTRIKSGVVQRLEVIESLSFQGQELTPGAATDEKTKVSSNDTTAGYLNGKLVAGSGIVLTENNNGGNETLTISANAVDLDVKVSVSANDTTAGYLNGKLVAGTNVAFVENNNGGDETLTINVSVPVTSVNTKTGAVTLTATDVGAAATVHTHTASDVTSGVFGTARLALTGTASASTYLRGDQSWSGLDAGHITTGTVPTARLGSGTANGTTFLAGDQTYKTPPYPVTSVNGATGAVTIGAGDTTYSLTVQDAENTTATRNLCQFTVAANTILDGEIIIVRLWYQANNMSGVAGNAFNVGISWTGNSFGEYSAGSLTGGENGRFGIAEFWFARSGTTLGVYNAGAYGIYNSPPYNQMVMGSTFFPAYTNHVLDTRNWSFNPTTFSSNITFSITGRWNTANAAAYVRILNARAVKVTGQQT